MIIFSILLCRVVAPRCVPCHSFCADTSRAGKGVAFPTPYFIQGCCPIFQSTKRDAKLLLQLNLKVLPSTLTLFHYKVGGRFYSLQRGKQCSKF